MRRLGVAACLLSALLVLAGLYVAASAIAAKTSAATCWFASGTLYAVGLPIDVAFSVTSDAIPTGTTLYSADGAFETPTWASRAYFWVRGHGPSLLKPGAGLNDYHLVAYCEAGA
jgi:hypothetical protein